ncbi:membrane protein [Arthrobacter phage Truckee]|nr:membrane protein [Arthrobacter phage Truckee]
MRFRYDLESACSGRGYLMEPQMFWTLLLASLPGLVLSWGILFIRDIVRREQEKRKERVTYGRAIRDGHLSPMFGNVISDWERVFTWRAVHTLDNGWVIWRFVWRRRIAKHSHLGGPVDFWFQYLVKLQYVYD